MTETRHSARTRLRTLHTAARLCIPVVVLYFVFRRVDWTRFLEVLGQTNPWFAVLGIAYYPAVILLGAVRWRSLVACLLGRTVPLGFMLTQYWIGLALGMFAPASIGWDVYRVVVVGRRYGRYAGNVAAIVVEKVMALLNAVLMVLVLYPWVRGLTDGDQPLLRQLLQAAVAGLAAGLACAVLFVFLKRNRMALAIRGKLQALVARVTERALKATGQSAGGRAPAFSFTELFRPLFAPKPLLVVLSISLGIQLAAAVGNQILFRAAGCPIPLRVNIFLSPVFFLIFLLPISFGSLGVREATYVILYGLFGVPPETALLVSFLNLSGILLNNAIGAILIWFRRPESSLNGRGLAHER